MDNILFINACPRPDSRTRELAKHVLSKLEEIPLCVRYKLDGKEIDTMPFPSVLDRCEPVFETMKGWQCDISGIRNWWDLPEEAKA